MKSTRPPSQQERTERGVACLRPAFSISRFAPREQHPHSLFVATVVVTKHFGQVALFQKDADKNIGSRDSCEQQMSHGHPRRGPERNDETPIDRVAHELVKRRRLETRGWHPAADEIVDHLMQAEQLEMVDE